VLLPAGREPEIVGELVVQKRPRADLPDTDYSGLTVT
jgi:hypothetical protein